MSTYGDDLERALDGLQDAEQYAKDIGEPHLAREIGEIYQALGEAAPERHWEGP